MQRLSKWLRVRGSTGRARARVSRIGARPRLAWRTRRRSCSRRSGRRGLRRWLARRLRRVHGGYRGGYGHYHGVAPYVGPRYYGGGGYVGYPGYYWGWPAAWGWSAGARVYYRQHLLPKRQLPAVPRLGLGARSLDLDRRSLVLGPGALGRTRFLALSPTHRPRRSVSRPLPPRLGSPRGERS